MKKTIFLLTALVGSFFIASSQTTADNCPVIQEIIKDFDATNLSNIKGEEISTNLFSSKKDLVGFDFSQIRFDTFSDDFIAKSASAPKDNIKKQFDTQLDKMKLCLKDWQTSDNSNEYTTDIVFKSKLTKVEVHLMYQVDFGTDYALILMIQKPKSE